MKLIFMYEKLKYGTTLEPVVAWGYIPSLFFKFMRLWKGFKNNLSIDNNLQSLICLFVSKQNNCDFCIDLHTTILFNRDVNNSNKINYLDDFENHNTFSAKEKAALSYTMYLTNTPVAIPNSISDKLSNFFSDKEIVEITALASFQNMSSRFNSALKLSAKKENKHA